MTSDYTKRNTERRTWSLSLNYEELKRRNDTNINKLQNAPSITIIDQELWQTLIDLNKDQTTLLEDTADIQTVKTCTENSKKAVKTELINQTNSLKAKIEDLEKQVGNLNESISSVEKRLKKTDNISEELKQKWLPLLIGVPTAVQILSWTVYILWQVLQK